MVNSLNQSMRNYFLTESYNKDKIIPKSTITSANITLFNTTNTDAKSQKPKG